MDSLSNFSDNEKTFSCDWIAEISSEKNYPQIPEIEIKKKIGQGGMGVVYMGRQIYLDRIVAVKVISLNQCTNVENFLSRFKREAKLLASLSHPNIVSCHHAGWLPDGKCYLVMEFIEGMDLEKYIQKNGVLTENQAIGVLKSLAMALDHAYTMEIIHRDIKPENILLQPYDIRKSSIDKVSEDFPYNVKLVDMGLAKINSMKEEAQVTKEGQIMGTPAYMAPEQFESINTLDYRGDIYSLGCVLYYMLTGKNAFPQNGIHAIFLQKLENNIPEIKQFRANLSPGLSQMIYSMIQKNREDRPQSYQEILSFCTQFENELKAPCTIANPIALPDLPSTHNHKKTLVVMIIFVFLGIISVAGLYWLFNMPDNRTSSIVSMPKIDPVPQEPEEKKIISPKQSEIPEKITAAIRPTSWKTPNSLFSDTKYEQRMEEWKIEENQTGWSASEEGIGVFGFGTGYAERKIDKSPWQIEGTILPVSVDSREWGVHFVLNDSSEIEMNCKILKNIFVNVVEKDKAGQRKNLLSFTSKYNPHNPDEIFFQAVQYQNILEIMINKQHSLSIKVSFPIEQIKLSVKKSSGVYFKSLQIQHASE